MEIEADLKLQELGGWGRCWAMEMGISPDFCCSKMGIPLCRTGTSLRELGMITCSLNVDVTLISRRKLEGWLQEELGTSTKSGSSHWKVDVEPTLGDVILRNRKHMDPSSSPIIWAGVVGIHLEETSLLTHEKKNLAIRCYFQHGSESPRVAMLFETTWLFSDLVPFVDYKTLKQHVHWFALSCCWLAPCFNPRRCSLASIYCYIPRLFNDPSFPWISILVCGFEHFLMFPIYWEWSSQLITVIFFRGVETTNQHMSGGEKSEYMMSNYHFHRWNRNVWWSNHYCLLVIHSAFWVVQSPSYSRILIVQVKSVKMLLVVKQ